MITSNHKYCQIIFFPCLALSCNPPPPQKKTGKYSNDNFDNYIDKDLKYLGTACERNC